ncbi:molybdate ABC transporter substrate-binding protein [Brevibacillus massiliensis]|uniref:molybdate ABC transporter substrate-binding protein n=1 Tax=Brevibacillus massiliensis TaxID=1118054 RepID=UPI0003077CB8|nr:molybdate ABC transporter substrate-binding protein [Brevibacillus massiliensis]
MLKKWAILLSALFILAVPVGCSSVTQQQSAGQPEQQAATGAGADQTDQTGAQTPGKDAELMVSAAASLTDALQELKSGFESEHPGVTLTYVFGSSGKLAQQIENGAPVDVFLSASGKDMDKLQEKNLIKQDTRIDFAKNQLVLVANKSSSLQLDSFEQIAPDKVEHFAIGEPESVPAGRYAKEVLEHLKLWDSLQSKLVFANDVRQVLTYVESGNADLGAVYASDAVIAKQVKVLATADSNWHKPIVYPGAVVASAAHPVEAKAFLDYLQGDKGKEVLEKYGFTQ